MARAEVAIAVSRGLTKLAVAGVALAVVAPLANAFPLVLLEHFRVQYAVVAPFVVAAAAALRLRGWLDAAVIGAASAIPPTARHCGSCY